MRTSAAVVCLFATIANAQQSHVLPCIGANALTYVLPCNQSIGQEATLSAYAQGPGGFDGYTVVNLLQANTQYTGNHFIQFPPNYVNYPVSQCSTYGCSESESYNQTQAESTQATRYTFNPGTTCPQTNAAPPCIDLLIGVPWIGDNATSAAIPDSPHAILPAINGQFFVTGKFAYDANFATQELDFNVYLSGTQYVVATQCILGDYVYVSNMPGTAWTKTANSCPLVASSTNTYTLLGQINKSASPQSVTYQTVIINGKTIPLGITVNACNTANSCSTAPPTSYYGVNAQVQSSNQTAATTFTVYELKAGYR